MKVAILGKIHQDGLDYLKSQNVSITEINEYRVAIALKYMNIIFY